MAKIYVKVGKAGVGKTYQTYKQMDKDKDKFPIQMRLPFAGAFKNFLKSIGITKTQNNCQLSAKEIYDKLGVFTQNYTYTNEVQDNIDTLIEGILNKKSPRWIMQYFGTEVLRLIDKDFHVKKLLQRIDETKYFVDAYYIDDLRFMNELKGIVQYCDTNKNIKLNIEVLSETDEVRQKRLKLSDKDFKALESHESEQEINDIIYVLKEAYLKLQGES